MISYVQKNCLCNSTNNLEYVSFEYFISFFSMNINLKIYNDTVLLINDGNFIFGAGNV